VQGPEVDGGERAGVRDAHEDRGEGELGEASKEGNREVEHEEHEVRDVRNRSDGNVERD